MKKIRGFINWILVISVLSITLVGCGSSPVGNSDAAYFNGKTVTIIVPHGAGGGFDTYARLIAPYLQKYLPGSTVVVQNMPDQGGSVGRNQIYTAKPDGLTIGLTDGMGTLYSEWAGEQGVNYKTFDFSWVGRIYSEPHVMAVSTKSPYKTIEDVIKAGKLTMGFSGVGGSGDYYNAGVIAKLLGYQLEPKTDYKSSKESNLACVKGDVESIQISYGSIKSLLDAKTVVPILVFNDKRIPELPDVPTVLEKFTGDNLKIVQTLVGVYELDRVVIAPPGMPAGRLQALRDALDKAVTDPDFLAASKKMDRPIQYISGSEIVKLLDNIKAAQDVIKPLIQK